METSTHLIIDVDPIAEEEEDIEIPFVAAIQVSGENSKKSEMVRQKRKEVFV